MMKLAKCLKCDKTVIGCGLEGIRSKCETCPYNNSPEVCEGIRKVNSWHLYYENIFDKYSNLGVQKALNIRAHEIWDGNRIQDVFIEEAAESIQAVIHFRRGRCDLDNLFGEMADLQIMLDQMKVIFGQYEFDKILASKYAALDKKLDSIESGNVIL